MQAPLILLDARKLISVFLREGVVVIIWQVCGHALAEAYSKTKHNKSVFTNLKKPALQSIY